MWNKAQPSAVREVLELRLNSPAEYRARVERSRPGGSEVRIGRGAAAELTLEIGASAADQTTLHLVRGKENGRSRGRPLYPAAPEESASVGFEQPPPDFIGRIREELEATLRVVRESVTSPWPDLTRATLAELRFHSIARWLPDHEAATLRTAFDAEMDRLYEREDNRDDRIGAPGAK